MSGSEKKQNERQVYSVADLNLQIKRSIEGQFGSIWVAGEVSNLSRPQSGHYYFTLKDESAQIRAVIWRSTVERLKFDLEEGQEFICHGDVDLYVPRGSYQLIVRKVEPVGQGSWQLAFKKLHARLAAEGLFDVEHKQPLPAFPARIGVITSPTGAAVRDFAQVVNRRWPQMDILIIPSRVQGDEAPEDIVHALRAASRVRPMLDLILITRGGGSPEDLWCFNDERVVRAVHRCPLPTVSAIGHEIDVSLTDLVADRRALTPTEAGEVVTPDRREWFDALGEAKYRLESLLKRRAVDARRRVDVIAASRYFRRPHDVIQEYARQIDSATARLNQIMKQKVEGDQQKLAKRAAQLHALSPLAVLSRGYSLTTTQSGKLVRDTAQIAIDDHLLTRFDWGAVHSRITQIEENE